MLNPDSIARIEATGFDNPRYPARREHVASAVADDFFKQPRTARTELIDRFCELNRVKRIAELTSEQARERELLLKQLNGK